MNPDYELILKLQQTNIDIFIDVVTFGWLDWILYFLFFLGVFAMFFYFGYKKGEFDIREKYGLEYVKIIDGPSRISE